MKIGVIEGFADRQTGEIADGGIRVVRFDAVAPLATRPVPVTANRP